MMFGFTAATQVGCVAPEVTICRHPIGLEDNIDSSLSNDDSDRMDAKLPCYVQVIRSAIDLANIPGN